MRREVKINFEEFLRRLNTPIKAHEEIKIPKLNELNKPELTQKQISILFKVFKDKKIFNNRDIDKTDFAKIICQLTGYSNNTLRQNFSTNESTDISVNQNDYEIIIDKLNEVIIEIKKQKQKISN